MANQLYTSAIVLLDGTLLSQATNVTIDWNGNHSRIKTLAGGFVGLSKGAFITEISIDNVVPELGFEFEPSTAISNVEEHQLTIFAGEEALNIAVFIESGSFSKGVDSEPKLSFKAVGGLAVFE